MSATHDDRRPGGRAPGSQRSVRPDQGGSENAAPPLPDEARPELLPRAVRRSLETLAPAVAERTARHLAAAGLFVDEDPERATAHARYAKEQAPRLAETREALGVAAYAAGDYLLARAELRAARRLSGAAELIPLLADCERALGRPEAALTLAALPEAARLTRDDRVELAIVAAGARRDLGEPDQALAVLRLPELGATEAAATASPTVLRLWYAYADTLAAADRHEESAAWMARVAELDEEEITDAAERTGG